MSELRRLTTRDVDLIRFAAREAASTIGHIKAQGYEPHGDGGHPSENAEAILRMVFGLAEWGKPTPTVKGARLLARFREIAERMIAAGDGEHARTLRRAYGMPLRGDPLGVEELSRRPEVAQLARFTRAAQARAMKTAGTAVHEQDLQDRAAREVWNASGKKSRDVEFLATVTGEGHRMLSRAADAFVAAREAVDRDAAERKAADCRRPAAILALG